MVIDERKPIATPVTLTVISCPYVAECDYISGNNALTAEWYRNDFGLPRRACAWCGPHRPRGPRRHEAEAGGEPGAGLAPARLTDVARLVLQARGTREQAGAQRYTSTFLLRPTPPPRLLYRPRPRQICQTGKVLAYGTLPASRPECHTVSIPADRSVIAVNPTFTSIQAITPALEGAAPGTSHGATGRPRQADATGGRSLAAARQHRRARRTAGNRSRR